MFGTYPSFQPFKARALFVQPAKIVILFDLRHFFDNIDNIDNIDGIGGIGGIHST